MPSENVDVWGSIKSGWPFFYILVPILIITADIFFIKIREKWMTMYLISVTNTLFLLILSFYYKKKCLLYFVSILITIGIFYLLFLQMEGLQAFYGSMLLSISGGCLAASIAFLGSTTDHTSGKSVRQILTSTTFLSFFVALFIFYFNQINEYYNLHVQLKSIGDAVGYISLILPAGSFVVPIISYYYGKLYFGKDKSQNNFSFLISGAILSFLIGCIFATLPFVFWSIVKWIHPVIYPFMVTSWALIASFIFLLDIKAFNPTDFFKYLKRNLNLIPGDSSGHPSLRDLLRSCILYAIIIQISVLLTVLFIDLNQLICFFKSYWKFVLLIVSITFVLVRIILKRFLKWIVFRL